MAIKKENVYAVALLIKHGANPNLLMDGKTSAFDNAQAMNKLDILEILRGESSLLNYSDDDLVKGYKSVRKEDVEDISEIEIPETTGTDPYSRYKNPAEVLQKLNRTSFEEVPQNMNLQMLQQIQARQAQMQAKPQKKEKPKRMTAKEKQKRKWTVTKAGDEQTKMKEEKEKEATKTDFDKEALLDEAEELILNEQKSKSNKKKKNPPPPPPKKEEKPKPQEETKPAPKQTPKQKEKPQLKKIGKDLKRIESSESGDEDGNNEPIEMPLFSQPEQETKLNKSKSKNKKKEAANAKNKDDTKNDEEIEKPKSVGNEQIIDSSDSITLIKKQLELQQKQVEFQQKMLESMLSNQNSKPFPQPVYYPEMQMAQPVYYPYMPVPGVPQPIHAAPPPIPGMVPQFNQPMMPQMGMMPPYMSIQQVPLTQIPVSPYNQPSPAMNVPIEEFTQLDEKITSLERTLAPSIKQFSNSLPQSLGSCNTCNSPASNLCPYCSLPFCSHCREIHNTNFCRKTI